MADGRAGIEAPQPVLHDPAHDQLIGRQEGGHGRPGGLSGDIGQLDVPDAGLEPGRELPICGDDHTHQVEPLGQRLADGSADLLGVTRLGEGDLEVLGLAGSTCGRGVGIRDARVRAEPGTHRNRHLCPTQRPLEAALEVTMTGEAHPAVLGVLNVQALGDRDGNAARVRTRHCYFTTLSGSNESPVGPT